MAQQKKQPRLPKIGKHSSGQARITIGGHVHYLGAFGSLEAQKNYTALVERWEKNGRQPLEPARTVVQTQTLRDLFARWFAQLDASGRYQKNGKPTSSRIRLRTNVDEFMVRFGDVRTGDYTERLLLLHRDDLETHAKLTRVGINRKIGEVREGLRWGYERGHIGRDAWLATSAMRPLSRAVAGNRESKRAKRAPTAKEIEAVALALGPTIGRMLRLHHMLGCRPGELLAMRWSDINRELVQGCWTYCVRDAKSSHHGHETSYAIPPRAQALLAEIPVQAPDALIFTLSTPSMTDRSGARQWTTIAYRERLQRACKRAKVQPFTGHEVRHSAITAACAKFGAFAAASFANHTRISTTETYLHRDNLDRYRVAAGLAGDAAAS